MTTRPNDHAVQRLTRNGGVVCLGTFDLKFEPGSFENAPLPNFVASDRQ